MKNQLTRQPYAIHCIQYQIVNISNIISVHYSPEIQFFEHSMYFVINANIINTIAMAPL